MPQAPSPKPASPVSVIVVSYNTRDKLRKCLSKIEPEHEVIVVDNASSDGSADMVESEFPHVRLIRNTENRGFGAANNQGLDVMTRPFALFLNSDCYAKPGAIARLAHSVAGDHVVAAGGMLTHANCKRQDSAANELTLWVVFCEQTWLQDLFPGSIFDPYWVHPPHGGSVAQCMGACLMIKPVERFDERFFLYCEDTELCKRLRTHGEIHYVPKAEFVHDLGSSSSRNRWFAVALYNRGKELYFAIHRGPAQAAACWLLNRFGALLRLAFWSLASILTLFLKRTTVARIGLFGRVLFAPVRGPRTP